jgi:hypothetical protein
MHLNLICLLLSVSRLNNKTKRQIDAKVDALVAAMAIPRILLKHNSLLPRLKKLPQPEIIRDGPFATEISKQATASISIPEPWSKQIIRSFQPHLTSCRIITLNLSHRAENDGQPWLL